MHLNYLLTLLRKGRIRLTYKFSHINPGQCKRSVQIVLLKSPFIFVSIVR